MINLSTEITPLQAINEIAKAVKETRAASLSEYTTSTRLYPKVLVDASLTRQDDDVLYNAMQTMGGVYAAHYMQAVTMANIQSINNLQLLDQFATERSFGNSGIIPGALDQVATESFHKLVPFAMEAFDDDKDAKPEKPHQGNKMDMDKINLGEAVNLAVGRQLRVYIGVGEQAIGIDITLQLNPEVIPAQALPDVLALTTTDKSYVGRFRQWRSGEIDSFNDYLWGLDIIERDRKALLNDPSGIYSEARRKKSTSRWQSLLSGKKSINMASTMAVISTGVADEMQLSIKGKLKRPNVREKYFDATNSMMLMVLDQRKERVTLYQRGIAKHGVYSFRDIEKVGKSNDGMDIGAVLQAYKMGDAPSL